MTSFDDRSLVCERGASRRPGRGSVSRDVNGERLIVCGWSAAILMQLAHPLVAAGVARHSGFRASATAPVARLAHTIDAMLGLTFGTDEEARAVVARIRGVHDRVHGELEESTRAFAAGHHYSAHDPRLLAWVHATLLDAVLRTYELFVRPLREDERDRYCAEARAVASWLGVPSAELPSSAAAMRAKIDERIASGEIPAGEHAGSRAPRDDGDDSDDSDDNPGTGRASAGATPSVTRDAAALAHAILRPAIGRWIWPLGAAHRLITIGLLPPAFRAAYGLTWNARQERRLQRLARIVRACRRVAPPRLARWSAARRADATRDEGATTLRRRAAHVDAWTRRRSRPRRV